MKDKYLKNFREKTKDELLYIIDNQTSYNKDAIAAAHELLRKKTATFSEYQQLTNGKTDFKETRTHRDKDASNIVLTVLKWIGIILFFPLSLVVIGYYKNKKAKKEYYANNRPLSER